MRNYKSIITFSKNGRGIWDLDTSKGCSSGLAANPRGCYGDCYAAKIAKAYGVNFSKTILRDFKNLKHQREIINQINQIKEPFIRIGCSGDPSENWGHCFSILRKIKRVNKEIVIITRHWETIPYGLLDELKSYNLCINSSISAMDSPKDLARCLSEYKRLKHYCRSVLRIVSCDFNQENETGAAMAAIQNALFLNENTIDTIFRPNKNNPLILDGVINVKRSGFMGGIQLISKFNKKTYTGKCSACTEQCGVYKDRIRATPTLTQQSIF